MHQVGSSVGEPAAKLHQTEGIRLREAEDLGRHAGVGKALGKLREDPAAEAPHGGLDAATAGFHQVDETGLGASGAEMIDQMENPHPTP